MGSQDMITKGYEQARQPSPPWTRYRRRRIKEAGDITFYDGDGAVRLRIEDDDVNRWSFPTVAASTANLLITPVDVPAGSLFPVLRQ